MDRSDHCLVQLLQAAEVMLAQGHHILFIIEHTELVIPRLSELTEVLVQSEQFGSLYPSGIRTVLVDVHFVNDRVALSTQ